MKKILLALFLLLSFRAFTQTITEIHYPLYVQGVGSGNPPDDRKVPFACRMQINGLLANATYRYYSRFGNAPTGSSGTGFYILANKTGDFTRITSASLANPGSYGEFTTNASGSATDWFIVEPSSAIDFAPGNTLYWRIFLNNGAGGAAVITRLTAANPVTVLGWGTATNQGTGLRSTAIPAYAPKNFVMLFDNESGTGRPVAGTFIESDGTLNGSALNGDPFTAGYAPFYGDNVDGVNKAWGTIIPNNLSTGIRNISEYALTTGSKLRACASPNGIYGATNTANVNGGLTALVLTCNPIAIPVSLTSFTASLMVGNKVDLQWITASEIGVLYFEVERSTSGTSFTSIGKLDAKGDNSNYSMNDNLKTGTTYYRLKIVDNNGRFSYSNVVTVNGKVKGGVIIFPNPANTTITVSHNVAQSESTIQVYNIDGSRLLTQKLVGAAFQTTVDVSKFVRGNYLLVVENAVQKESIHFYKN